MLALLERPGIFRVPLLVGMEAAGHYWLSGYKYLLEQGLEVKVSNPIQLKAFRKMYIRQAKDDRKGNLVIALIMRFAQFSALMK